MVFDGRFSINLKLKLIYNYDKDFEKRTKGIISLFGPSFFGLHLDIKGTLIIQKMRRQHQQMRTVQPNNNATPLDNNNSLDFLSAMGVGIAAVMQNAAEQGLSTKNIDKLYVDQEAFDDVVSGHLKTLNEDENFGNDVEADVDDGSSDEYCDPSRRIDKFIDKKEGDNFTITQHFSFQGTLQAFKDGRAPTSLVMVCSDMEGADHRPLVKESKVTMIQNSTPFLVNFKLEGTPSTNIQMDENDGTHKRVTYKIPSDAVTPMCVNTPIFCHGEGIDFELDNLQEKFAYTTPSEIQASVQFPAIQEFIGDKIPSQKELDQYAAAKEAFSNAQQNFVMINSPLGEFIQENSSNSRVALAWEKKFPNHLLLPQKEIDSQIGEMINMIETSPIGKMHGMTGSISRHDGQTWDFIPEGISEEEAQHLLNTRQTILVTVEHHVQAYLGE